MIHLNLRKVKQTWFSLIENFVTYIIEDIACFCIICNGLDCFEENLVLSFQKDGKKYIITVNNDKIDFDEIIKIAKEIEYT